MVERLIISPPFYITEPASRCGYCHGKKANTEDNFSLRSWSELHSKNEDQIEFENCTLGFPTESMSVEMYDKWCNMGFRRSGKFLYKTDILRNCCRLYTIRTTPDDVQVSKDLKKTLKRFKRQILEGQERRENSTAKNNSGLEFDYMKEIIAAESESNHFKTVFEPAIFSQEKYDLFVRYQENIHKDFKNSEKSFKSFLCDSPFSEETIMGTEEEWDQLNNWRKMGRTEKLKRLGPTHECYYYKNKLIAIAVTDFLPTGISSVYFIWDPDYYKWSLGKLSALRELCITKSINRNYYYMGYYIEDCPKMAYKAKYGGELLDVCQHEYLPLNFLHTHANLERMFAFVNEGSTTNGELSLNRRLAGPAPSATTNVILEDLSESIYGFKGSATANANFSAQKLSQMGIPYLNDRKQSFYRIKGKPRDSKPSFELPNVFPGLIPLPEILKLLETGELDKLNNMVMIYDLEMGGLRPMSNFRDEPPEIKKLVCNIVRCIGLNNIIGAIIIT